MPENSRRNYPLLLASQFLGAFGDNALLAVIVGQLTLMQKAGRITSEELRTTNTIYTSLLFIPYVLLAPLAGYLNDRYAKTSWLRGGNLIKLLGTFVCALSVWYGYAWQGIGYFIVGIGSTFYGPAKYGILPEILPRERLVKANGMVELLTLVAILTGAIGGSVIVDQLPVIQCYAILLLVFGASFGLNLLMSATPFNPAVKLGTSAGEFFTHFGGLLSAPRLGRVLIGTALFWVCGATMKINFQPWGLEVLKLPDNTQIALLGLWLSVGVMAGSLLAGQLHQVGDLRWTRRYGFILAAMLAVVCSIERLGLAFTGRLDWHLTLAQHQVSFIVIFPVIVILVATGLMAGLFLIPLNAALQAESDPAKLGKTIATQNFTDNCGMIFAGLFCFAGVKLHLSSSQVFLGLALMLTAIIAWLRIPLNRTRRNDRPGSEPVKAAEQNPAAPPGLSHRAAVLCSLGAVASFQLAYTYSPLAWLMIVYLGCLVTLTRLSSNRQAFCLGLLVGLGVFVPQMGFFWTIFGAAAIPLWLVLAFWPALFLMLGRQCRLHLGNGVASLLLPFIWTGLEYFRCEVYFLRFSWFTPGGAFWEWPIVISLLGGVYGVGFWLMFVWLLLRCWWALGPGRLRFYTLLVPILTLLSCIFLPAISSTGRTSMPLKVAGIQMEFPHPDRVINGLDRLVVSHPEAELLVLSEYTFDGPIPNSVKGWCRENHRWLIAGGQDALEGGKYYNTAFVVSTNGDIVFKQAKCMPIQFFKDGLPAKEQKLWESPWGKIGLCVCYDLNYRHVTDELIRQGAQMIVVPTMDVADWGAHQHQLHARTAPIRAAEYGVPIVRLCSSGISQIVSRGGRLVATAPFPGDGEMIAGAVRLPFSFHSVIFLFEDLIIPPALGATLGTILYLLVEWFADRFLKRVIPNTGRTPLNTSP